MRLVRLSRSGPRVWLAWSGGKNAAHALDVLRRADEVRVEGLATFFDERGCAIGSQVPRSLIEEQASSVGLALVAIDLPPERAAMDLPDALAAAVAALRPRGAEVLAFGDAEGAPSRSRHEALALAAGLRPSFPLESTPPARLAHELLDAGVRAVLTAVDRTRVPRAWVGRTYSASLLDEMPAGADPTGARGEFHSFVCGAPALQRPVSPRWADLEQVGDWAVARLVPGPRRGYGEGSVDL